MPQHPRRGRLNCKDTGRHPRAHRRLQARLHARQRTAHRLVAPGAGGSQGVLLLLSDSTYSELPGYTPSEKVVGEALDVIIANAPCRVLVTTFASLISRMQQIINAAAEHPPRLRGGPQHDRQRAHGLRPGLPHPAPRRHGAYRRTGAHPSREDCHPHHRQPGRAHLRGWCASPAAPTTITSRPAIRSSSRPRPSPATNRWWQPHRGHPLQTGRPGVPRSRTRRTCTATPARRSSNYDAPRKPKYFVPVHGEYRHLSLHAKLAQSVGIPEKNIFVMEDGDVLELDAAAARSGAR